MVNDVTTAPLELVKVMTFPLTRPVYLVPGCAASGVTVSEVEAYLVQTRLM